MPGTVDNKLIFHLGVLVPFWVLELIAELIAVAAGALGLSAAIALANSNVGCTYDQYGDYACDYINQSAVNTALAATGVEVGLGCVFVILHIIQIALFGRRRLTPAANFGIELSRFVIWLVVLILVIVAVASSSTGGFGLIFAIIVWALYLGSTIYSIVIFHRARRGRFNGPSSEYTMSAVGPAPATYAAKQPRVQETPVGVQEHYGPGPYQHPSEIQQTPHQQPQTYQPGQAPVSPISSAQPTQRSSAYVPAHQFTGFPEKEAVNNGP